MENNLFPKKIIFFVILVILGVVWYTNIAESSNSKMDSQSSYFDRRDQQKLYFELKELKNEVENDHQRIASLEHQINGLSKLLENNGTESLELKSPVPVSTEAPNEKHYFGDITKSTCQGIETQEEIDVVFTWVNGSDPTFVEDLKKSDLGSKTHKDDTKQQRFEDFNQLIYAIRSIEIYSPWIRRIYIVTNGQIPFWLNITNPKVKIVTHKQIFQHKDHLPTFNSMAIEVHLHQIEGLSEKFIYFNDDISLMKQICLSDFWTAEGGYKIYQHGEVGRKVLSETCSEECVSVKMSDGNCDQECNSIGCFWDGDDCDGITPPGGEKDHRPAFYQAIDFVNILYERTLTENKRHWLPHIPYMFNRKIMREMQEHYNIEFELTSRHKKRQKNDMQPEFAYVHWLQEAPKSKNVKVDPNEYRNQPGRIGVGYISYYNNMMKNKPQLEKIKKDKNLKFLCINDLMDHDKPDAILAKEKLEEFYLQLYPHKSSVEI